MRKEQKAHAVTYILPYSTHVGGGWQTLRCGGSHLWILYELGLLLAYLFVRKEKRPQA